MAESRRGPDRAGPSTARNLLLGYLQWIDVSVLIRVIRGWAVGSGMWRATSRIQQRINRGRQRDELLHQPGGCGFEIGFI